MVKYDHKGWADASSFHPMKGDLITLKCIKNDKENKINGWWNGNEWDGYKLKKDMIVIAWRKDHE